MALIQGIIYRQSFAHNIDQPSLTFLPHLVSTTKISKGTLIKKEMLDIKRPGTGIPPKFLDKVIGTKAVKDIEEDKENEL